MSWWMTAALLSLAGCAGRPATEEAVPGAAEPAGGAITLWSDSTELFMEHPALIVGAPDKFAVHLTDLTDFTPLASGRVTLKFQPRDGGNPLVVVQDVPRAPGIYGPAPTFTRAGTYDLSILVDSPQAQDSLFVPGLVVYAAAADAPTEVTGEVSGVSFLKEQQWKTEGFRTAFASDGEVSGSFEASGVLEVPTGSIAVVSAPVSGLVDAASLAAAPIPGQRVSRGQVLAELAPSLGEGGGAAMADARARLREAEDELERAKRLLAVEAVPQRRVHEATIRLDAAREALVGYGSGEEGRVLIRAPLAGVVTDRHVTPGSRTEGGAPLFTIVDPRVLWLRVDVPAAQVDALSPRSGAEFRVEGAPRARVAPRLVSVGSVIDSMSRTLAVRFAVENRDGALKVGAHARVMVRLGEREAGVLVPDTAILDEDGRPVVFVQVDGESFEKRAVSLGARERGRVLVRTGIKAGDRVVTGAAYQVRLASLSTSVPDHGHEH